MNELDKAALAVYDTAKRRLAENKPNDRGAEAGFALAYRALVVRGLALPLKRKYRNF